MNLKLIGDISKSLLLARWRQTLIAAIGVTFSITMYITLMGFMNGLNGMLDSLILNRTPHIRLYNEIEASQHQPVNLAPTHNKHYNFINSVKPKNQRQEIYNYGALINTLKKDNRVLGFAPKITVQVFYNVGSTDLNGLINGIDVEQENKLFALKDYITGGSLQDLKNIPNSIILGKGIAEKILADIGDVIQVTTSKGEQFMLKVVGYYQSGISDIDKVQSYTSLACGQKLLGEISTYVTDVQIKLKDLNQAPQIALEYSSIFNVHATDIQTANAQFETGTKVRNLISYAVSITLLIVAGFGIYNILNMMIYEKMDTIAILKATGFSGKDVNRVFIGIALSIGIAGGIIGLVLGFGISVLIDQIPFNTAALPTIKTYPISYNPMYYITGILFSLLTTYFAGYFPARKASKIDPVIIIRGK